MTNVFVRHFVYCWKGSLFSWLEWIHFPDIGLSFLPIWLWPAPSSEGLQSIRSNDMVEHKNNLRPKDFLYRKVGMNMGTRWQDPQVLLYAPPQHSRLPEHYRTTFCDCSWGQLGEDMLHQWEGGALIPETHCGMFAFCSWNFKQCRCSS